MRICLVQAFAEKGEILTNIQNHLRLIDKAIQSKTDLIIFPELSITGYEPLLADKLACKVTDDRFDPFQELADAHQVTIGIGVPTRSVAGINISTVFFQPNRERLCYSKQMLHEDELPYFVSGTNQPVLITAGKRIGFGICYETLQRSHFVQAMEDEADVHIASVAKPDRGTQKAYVHFPSMANEFNIPILMANCVGFCDDFLSNGKSAVWNREGKLLAQLDEVSQGLLIYDSELEEVTCLQDI